MVLVSTKLEGLSANVHLVSSGQGVKEISTSVFQIRVRPPGLKTVSNLSTITIATANQVTWEDTVMLKSTSVLTHLVRTEVFVQLYREDTSVSAAMAFTAKTVNIQGMLAIPTRVKMVDTAEHQKLGATFVTVLLAYQVSTAKLTP